MEARRWNFWIFPANSLDRKKISFFIVGRGGETRRNKEKDLSRNFSLEETLNWFAGGNFFFPWSIHALPFPRSANSTGKLRNRFPLSRMENTVGRLWNISASHRLYCIITMKEDYPIIFRRLNTRIICKNPLTQLISRLSPRPSLLNSSLLVHVP